MIRTQALTDPERSITKRIHEFDLICLIHLLQYFGYQPDEIRFKSRLSASSQPGLIHHIAFHKDPVQRVVITLNLGMLSAQSPLPSYFFKKLDTGYIDTQSFADFIGYFDHLLIQNYLINIYPELNRALYPDLELTKRRFLQLLDIKSCSTLHWLFQLVFPELGVHAEKIVLNRQVRAAGLRLGVTMLGADAIFGGKTRLPIDGRRITLFSEFETIYPGEPWPREIKKRLNDQIFPILKSVGMDLEIVLIILTQKTWAKLQPDSYLGYDKIQGGEESYRRIRIFTGRLQDE